MNDKVGPYIQKYPEIRVSQKSSIEKVTKPVPFVEGKFKIPENFEELQFECHSKYPTRWTLVPSPVTTTRCYADFMLSYLNI